MNGLLKGLMSGSVAGALLLAPPAAAATVTQADVQALRDQIAELNTKIGDLRRSMANQTSGAGHNADVHVSLDRGRLSFASPEGDFSASLRALVQYDYAYYGQGKAPAGIDLSSGGNFRRAQIGLVGSVFRDWSYNLTFDFGGTGTEKSGYIYTAYIEYDGLKPFGARIGAYAPPAGLEDSTGSADLIFLERPASSDVARNIAGAPSRDSVTVFAQGNTYLAALSYTGGKVGDSAVFDEQQALVGRLADLAYTDNDTQILLDADASYVFKLADNAPGPGSPTSASLSIGPELAVDGSKLINTGTIDASRVGEFGGEAAAEWRSLFLQGGYFHFDIVRRTGALPNPQFDGWYALVAWTLTGERRKYDPETASFRQPRPDAPLGSKGGMGAWELAARFSELDLNDHPELSAAAGGVRGGKQDVWSLAVNWYPNAAIRFALDFENITVARLSSAGADIGVDANAVALRAQLAL